MELVDLGSIAVSGACTCTTSVLGQQRDCFPAFEDIATEAHVYYIASSRDAKTCHGCEARQEKRFWRDPQSPTKEGTI